MTAKPTKATRVIHEQAKYVRDSEVIVWFNSSQQTVSIDPKEGEGTFMQGDEADTFIEEVRALCKRYPSLDEKTASEALAKPYVDSWE